MAKSKPKSVVAKIGKVSVYKPTPKGPYHARWTDAAKIRRSQKLDRNKAKALRLARKISSAVEDGAIGSHPHEPLRRTLESLLVEYRTKLLRGAADKHVGTVVNSLRAAFDAIGATKVSQVTAAKLEAYLDSVGSKKADETVAHHRGYLRSLFKWAYETERLPSDPTKALQRRKVVERRRRRQANPEPIVNKIIAAADEGPRPYERVAVRLGYWAGLRQREILNLRWCDIEIVECHRCNGAGSQPDGEPCKLCDNVGHVGLYKLLGTMQKNKKDTISEIQPPVTRYLMELRKARTEECGGRLNETERLLYNAPKCAKTLSEHRKQLCARAGVPYRNIKGEVCDWHSMRHSFLTNAAGYLKINQLKRAARHADIKTTAGYMHDDRDEQWEALASMSAKYTGPPPKPDPSPTASSGLRIVNRAGGDQ